MAGIDFDFVLVDEATQTKEPTLLCSLSSGATALVMIGDPKQLGPCVRVRGRRRGRGKPGVLVISQTLQF